MQALELQEPPSVQLKSPSECITPVSTVAAKPLNRYFPSSLEPVQYTISPDMPSFSSLRTSVPSHAASTSVDRLTMSSIPVSIQDTSRTEALTVAKAVSDLIAVYPTQSVPYPTPSCVGSASSSMLTPLPTLLTPNQSSLSRSPVRSSTQKLHLTRRMLLFLHLYCLCLRPCFLIQHLNHHYCCCLVLYSRLDTFLAFQKNFCSALLQVIFVVYLLQNIYL